jgi:hypothetical protein
VNLEESDALVGIGFLQMPTTRGRIIRLDGDAFASRTISRPGVRGTTGQRRSGRRFNWIRAETPSPIMMIPVRNVPSYVHRVPEIA